MVTAGGGRAAGMPTIGGYGQWEEAGACVGQQWEAATTTAE